MRIASHTIVKNEDRYLWFAINSIADFVDEIVIWDTGSSDDTLKIIQDLIDKYSNKIKFEKHNIDDPRKVTDLRQKMLVKNTADWVVMVDGDEVWWRDKARELTDFIRKNGENYDSCVVNYKNVVGDLYHYQDEEFGEYVIDGKKGFLTIRAFNAKIKGLVYKKDYPLEGLFDEGGAILQERDSKRRFHFEGMTYIHMTHMARSSLVKNKKYKFQNGLPLPLDYFYPESFFVGSPAYIKNIWSKRTSSYYLKSSLFDILRLVKKLVK